jgi:hypothetical protein
MDKKHREVLNKLSTVVAEWILSGFGAFYYSKENPDLYFLEIESGGGYIVNSSGEYLAKARLDSSIYKTVGVVGNDTD